MIYSIFSYFCTPFRLALSSTSLLMLVSLIALPHLPKPLTTLHVSAETETLAYRVTNPERVALNLEKINIEGKLPEETSFDTPTNLECVSGDLNLTMGTVVRYRRELDKRIILTIVGQALGSKPSTFQTSDTKSSRVILGPGSNLTIDPNDKDCKGKVPVVLPVWGPGEMGSELPEVAVMFNGSVKIYARSIKKLFFKTFASSLYKAGQIDLPPNSRITEKNGNIEWAGEDWIGAVRIPTKDDTGGFHAQVTTNAQELRVYQAGGATEGYDTIKVGLFAQIFNDPTLQWYQIRIAILLILAGIIVPLIDIIPPECFKSLKARLDNKKAIRRKLK